MATPDEMYDEADRLKDAGKLPEALAKYNEILALEPNHVITHSALAVVCMRLQQPQLAIEHAKKVCELEPNDAFSFTALSVTYQRAFVATQNHQFIQLAEEAMYKARAMQDARH